tara:strand:+ start:617 stop:748 length:132 start_codon:yes stop_codon:yes gene_type:complete
MRLTYSRTAIAGFRDTGATASTSSTSSSISATYYPTSTYGDPC